MLLLLLFSAEGVFQSERMIKKYSTRGIKPLKENHYPLLNDVSHELGGVQI